MKISVNGEEKFRSQRDQFAVGPTTQGYTLQFSVDGENWTSYPDSVPASEQLIVNGAMIYCFWRLSGNTDDNVVVIL